MDMACAKVILEDEDRMRWYRFHTLLDYVGRPILKNILYKKIGAPAGDGQNLYNFLLRFKSEFTDKNENQILYPKDRNTNDEAFDISLFGKVIYTILNTYEYNKYKPDVVKNIEKARNFSNEIRKWRNWLYHKGDKRLTKSILDEKWEVVGCLFEENGGDMALVNDLKTCNIFATTKYQQSSISILLQGSLDFFL